MSQKLLKRAAAGLKVQLLHPSDRGAVLAHLKKFFNEDEPTLRSKLRLPDFNQGDIDELDNDKLKPLKDNMSFCAIGEDGKIAGLLINAWEYERDYAMDVTSFRHPQSQAVAKMFQKAYLEADLFNRLQVDRILDLKVVAVDPRNKGLGSILLNETENLARSMGVRALKCDCTSRWSQRGLEAAGGWITASEVVYADYKDENGNVVVQSKAPHLSYQLKYKLLR